MGKVKLATRGIKQARALTKTRSIQRAIFQSNKAGSLVKKSAYAESNFQRYLLREHLRQAEKYGKETHKQLQNGKMRYYEYLNSSVKKGEMIGRQRVREWNPYSGLKRTWHETLDSTGTIRIVRPEMNNGKKIHYLFDKRGNFTGIR